MLKLKKSFILPASILCIVIVLLQANLQAQAAEVTEINISKEDIEAAGGFTSALKRMIPSDYDGSLRITVAPGTYDISQTYSMLPSDSTLILTGVTLKRTKECNIFKFGGANHSTQNIKIIGGTLDGGGKTGTVIKVGDFKNFSMKGTAIQNVMDAHEMEVAGVNGMTLTNCSFKDQIIPIGTNTNRYEAIQLDILSANHISGYTSKSIQSKNIKIDGCTFENVPRGIGSHTAILNCPVDNISITECTFKNIGGAAIQALNWINCTFRKNKITDAARGISIYSVRNANGTGTYLPSVIAAEGNETTAIPDAYSANDNQNIVIRDNFITLNAKDDPYAKFAKTGISIIGFNINKFTAATSSGGGLPIGNYYMSGVDISNNQITTAGYGMYLSNARKCKVTSNSITGKGFRSSDPKKKQYDGIFVLDSCKNNTFAGNTIKAMPRNGIFCMDNSSSTSITNNKISSCGGYGIGLFNGSTVVAGINKNNISKCKNTGISLSTKCTAKEITNNKISNCTGIGINIYKKSKVSKNIADNTIKGVSSKYHGISISTSSSVKGKITKNTITGTYYKSIAVDPTSSAKY